MKCVLGTLPKEHSLLTLQQVIEMHFLRLFFLAWLAFGTVTVFLLFWLCKRTAARLKDPLPDISAVPHTSASVLFG
jgi:hypothetical protein